MRTITTTVYTINELSEEAQKKACDYVRENWHDFYPWHSENQESLKGFAKFLGGKATWSVQMCGPSHAKTTDPPCYLLENDPYRSQDSYQPTDFIHDNQATIQKCCPFTGFHMDEPLLDPMREYLVNPSDKTMEQLIREGCDLWVKQYQDDWEFCYTDEYILDFFAANDYEFTENGKIV